MIKHYCRLDDTDKVLAATTIDTDFQDAPEEYPLEISDEVYKKQHLARYANGGWSFDEQPPPIPQPLSTEARLKLLERAMDDLLLGGL